MATLSKSDLDFILQQILIAEAHAAGADLTTLLPNSFVPFGLRTVDGSFNHLVPGQSEFGASDNTFPRLVDPVFRDDEDGDTFPGTTNTDYGNTGNVADADPRIISNLVADSTSNNPAAVQAFVEAELGTLDPDGTLRDLDGNVIPPGTLLTIPNTAPDEGLSAPFNSWFTFFGQFFDHGLDLVNKGGNGTVFIPLQADDPLIAGADGILEDDPDTLLVDESADNLPPSQQFMVLTRATLGPDGENVNQTTPFVDQNQTYTSHPSHQVFLREYVVGADGKTVATGKLLENSNVGGGLTTWADVKAQARDLLGINLTDEDVTNLPLERTDPYGKFIPDPATGFAQLIVGAGADGIFNTDDDDVLVGNSTTPVSTTTAVRTGHAFLDDIAHTANPRSTSGAMKTPDADDVANVDDLNPNTYDDELLDRHFITGDGRGNENIALTAVHHVFHAEHNRQVDEIKATILATGDTAFIESWLLDGANAGDGVQPLEWNGERLFQAARFATEMQYQHLVFEEFARKMQPMVDPFLAPEGFDTTINPAIVAEFAHAVFRVGHTMLPETVARFDSNFEPNDLPLINAFLNPLEFNANNTLSPEAAAGAIVRGMTRQVGNEIDEFVTEAVRNNLLGLPLDLGALNIARGRDTGIPTLNAARREFYEMTSDAQLKPYTSWTDLAMHLKHEASIVNFIAAYGTHISITSATTMADKRAAAALLVFGGDGEPADRLDFLNSTGDWANNGPHAKDVDGVTVTGLGNIDLWIGGLAERQMPFGGFLGSTFNFVFETQMEALQNGDRFYYLARTAGMNFLTELENNSFAKLVMLNTDTHHLPADIFSTPAFILEVDQTKQFTGLDPDGHGDPVEGGTPLLPIVIRDNPATPGLDDHYLRYTGEDHVVLGGTDEADILISSIGDDTLWGDGGDDRLEGGDGVDNIEGGDGDDIITDLGGDDVLKGNDGNDVIHGGNGFNLLLGGEGSDFIITGEDVSETFGGPGNDFILGAQMNLPTFGNEGDDWIEIGTSDGAGGDNFDPQEASIIVGHDVFITGGGFDEVDGEGADDIMVASDGEDHFGGGGGFDWASYANDKLGVTADLFINDLIEPPVAPSNQGILDRFAEVEGLSGSAFADVLSGDHADAAEIGIDGPLNGELKNPGFITGLQSLLDTFFGAPTATFGAGNIILGGGGSDIIEGRGGDDLIDGDRWLDLFIQIANHPELSEIFENNAAHSLNELVPYMLDGTINPGELSIARAILTGADNFDTALFTGNRADYTIAVNGVVINGNGPLNIGDNDIVTVTDNDPARDGADRLRSIERLQFSDTAVVLQTGLNSEPVGQLTINDDTPAVNQLLTVDALGITDADIAGSVIGDRPIRFIWQAEEAPGTGIFRDIVGLDGGQPATASGDEFRVTANLDGLALRVRAIYQDGDGTLENVFSAATAPVAGFIPPDVVPTPPEETLVNSPGNGIHLIRADLDFILAQIKIAEAHDDGNVLDTIQNSRLPFGLRTVDGSFNNLVRDQTDFGAADQPFPLQLDQIFRNEGDEDLFDPDGPFGPAAPTNNTNYASTVNVIDTDPRIISNLIVDQTVHNPSAVIANGTNAPIVSPGLDGIFGTDDDREVFFIPNTAPDEGLSAPFNAWFTFFGQFFDHGLDLVDKGGNGTVYIPLMPDDPLIAGADGEFGTTDDLPESQRFMLLSRATNVAVQAGADNLVGTADDVHFHNNETTPFVDQNQTYTSNASHQVFLREYTTITTDDGPRTANTGRLLDGANGGIGNWAEVKANAAQFLGIQLTDADVFDVPMLATDAYGNFIPGPNGFAQLVTNMGLIEGVAGGIDLNNLPGGATAGRTGHAFLNDIAHNAVPVFSSPGVLAPDADSDTGNDVDFDPLTGRNLEYDDELLNAHFVTGDGRGNENIGLTAVHFIFHAEHNRLVGHIKDVAIASNDVAFLNEWLLEPVTELPDTPAEKAALVWDGERLFQAARFGTEMQYQHLVFEEFARKVQPQIDVFLVEGQGYDSTINPAIVAEFAHVVYRFGHSMLTETVDRFDPDFNVIPNSNQPEATDQQIGLIAAFLNPLEFTASGGTDGEAAGALVRGLTRQSGNEIDEFVTEALRNNLLGLPLDLPTINLARGRDTGVPTLNQARAEFYAMTGDAQLKPYVSWADFAGSLKHEASLVNFIAAYGIHTSITSESTLLGKRAAAYALVYGADGIDGLPGTGDEPTVEVPSDRLDFLNGPSAETGLDTVDLWIGGLAEKQMPFGGLLGSTFNFVFETQLEKLQNGDRFYYLERTAGLNFVTELENNSFAKLIMANTNATHLPGDVFSSPAFILEVNDALQFTGIGDFGRDDPDGVLRNNPATATPDALFLQYTGEDHVVLGGTAGNDTIISSIGDDTLYGDAGNDRLEGGDGNDMILGGPGDDIITDIGGEDNIQGGDGNDAIHGGNSIDLILGGFGHDFIVTGPDEKESFGGPGNDFILSTRANEMSFGNEGDDWLEWGLADGSAGENFDTRGQDLIIGHDVFYGDSVSDRMDGEAGDDMMMGNGGFGDRYIGGSGFDWAVFTHETLGTTADLNLRAFDETPQPQSQASALARFDSMQGLSGSAVSDILLGDDDDAIAIALSGARGSVLNSTGIDLINGLGTFLNTAFVGGADGILGDDPLTDEVDEGADDNPTITQFGEGNIIVGGAGSDMVEGRGGNDVIDGDRWLNVQIGVYNNLNHDVLQSRHNTMAELADRVFSGELNPGRLGIIREIRDTPVNGPLTGSTYDTAIFSGLNSEYSIVFPTEPGGVVVVFHNLVADDGTIVVGGGVDGIDHLVNIERLQFNDIAVVVPGFEGANQGPNGLLTIETTTVPGQLSVSIAGVRDPDNPSDPVHPDGGPITGPVTYYWQADLRGDGIFTDIVIATGLGDLRATGTTFTPGPDEAGLALRVRAVYQDANGVLETVFSASTGGANTAPVIDSDGGGDTAAVSIAENTTAVTTVTAVDPDAGAELTFDLAGGDDEALFTINPLTGVLTFITAPDFEAPTDADTDNVYNVIVEVSDGIDIDTQTIDVTVTDAPGVTLTGGPGTQNFIGTDENDTLSGLAGADTLTGLGSGDLLIGGAGADTINAGDGDDTIQYTVNDGADIIDGGAGTDTLAILGTSVNNTLNVNFNGTTLIAIDSIASRVNVENVTADLLGGATDVLNYAGASTAVTVNLTTGAASGFTSIAGIENVNGGGGNDTFTGDGQANAFTGGGGNDRFVATVNDGNDSYTGGAGTTDTYDLSGTTAGATVNLTAGTSTSAQTGNDGLATIENVIGSSGADNITGSSGNVINNLAGQGGNDTFNYVMGGGADVVDGGADSDTLAITGNGANDVLDVVYNGSVLTTVEGGAVTNVETVTANLNAGTDTLNYGATASAVTVNLGTGAASGFGVAGITNIENVTGGTGADNLTGTDSTNTLDGGNGNGADVITGGGGTDTATGGGGDDRFVATVGDGNDTYTGGAGNDTYDLSGTGGGATVNLGTNTASGAQIGADTLATIENVFGSTGNDTITGTGAANVLEGRGGADTINAGGGADTVHGEGGNDTLNGGDGQDNLDGGADNDTLDGGAAADRLTGGAGNDSLTGGGANDIFVFGPDPGAEADVVLDFDANPAGGQDQIDLVTYGITAATFAAHVSITVADFGVGAIGLDTRLTIDGTDTITFAGVTGAGANVIAPGADFILAP
jgi:Ca2+-binding RTX toxin-like protein